MPSADDLAKGWYLVMIPNPDHPPASGTRVYFAGADDPPPKRCSEAGRFLVWDKLLSHTAAAGMPTVAPEELKKMREELESAPGVVKITRRNCGHGNRKTDAYLVEMGREKLGGIIFL